MRLSRTLTSTAIALAGLAAAAAGPLATSAPAGAAVSPIPVGVPCLIPAPANPVTDLITLTGVGVDFGKSGLNSSNDPNCASTVRWDTAGSTITPIIEGEIILKNSLGVNARVIASFKDVHGTSLGPARVTSTKVGTTNAEQAFPITINGFNSPQAYEASIATQILSGATWLDVDRESVFLGSSNQAADSVLISAVGQDFGTGPLVGGVPAAPGLLSWDTSASTIKAVATGDLIMTNSLGVNARVRVKTFDVHGLRLSNTPGPIQTPASNAQTAFATTVTSPGNPLIYSAETSIEVQVGASWLTVGTPVTSTI